MSVACAWNLVWLDVKTGLPMLQCVRSMLIFVMVTTTYNLEGDNMKKMVKVLKLNKVHSNGANELTVISFQ